MSPFDRDRHHLQPAQHRQRPDVGRGAARRARAAAARRAAAAAPDPARRARPRARPRGGRRRAPAAGLGERRRRLQRGRRTASCDAGNDRAVCAVRAAGNANDHRRTTRERPLADAIVAGDVRRIDLLRLTPGPADGRRRSGYAHSYIGVGADPGRRPSTSRRAARASWREIVSVVRGFARFRPFPHPAARTVGGAGSTAWCSPNIARDGQARDAQRGRRVRTTAGSR